MKVKEIMSKNIIKINNEITISKAAEIMDEKSIGSLVVEENGEMYGIITERDILKKLVAKGKDPSKTFVKEIMSHFIVKADVNTDIEEARDMLEKNNIRRLVITENDKIVGIITIRDINRNMRYLLGRRITESYTTQTYRPSYGRP